MSCKFKCVVIFIKIPASLLLSRSFNYEVDVERLKSRYGKEEVQRNRLMTELADMKSLEQSSKTMRDAVDELCTTVRAFEPF